MRLFLFAWCATVSVCMVCDCFCLHGVRLFLSAWCATVSACMVCDCFYLHGVRLFLLAWCATVSVCMVCDCFCLHGVRLFLFAWCATVSVCMVCDCFCLHGVRLFLFAWWSTAEVCSTFADSLLFSVKPSGCGSLNLLLGESSDIRDGDHTFGFCCVLILLFLDFSLLILLLFHLLYVQLGYPHLFSALVMCSTSSSLSSGSDTMLLHLSSNVVMTPRCDTVDGENYSSNTGQSGSSSNTLGFCVCRKSSDCNVYAIEIDDMSVLVHIPSSLYPSHHLHISSKHCLANK